ncbi:DeoR family transcriptional regulator [Micromonospora sp. LZ34]
MDETAVALGVSGATIRRDFDELATQQMVVRTRGGVTAQNIAYDLPLRYKIARHATEKQRIGVAAAGLIRPGFDSRSERWYDDHGSGTVTRRSL